MVQRDAKITVREKITVEGAMFYYLAPASLAGYIGTGMLDGAIGSLVEQSILGEGINIEQMLEEATLEGIFCGLLYGAGKLFGRVVAKFKGKSGINSPSDYNISFLLVCIQEPIREKYCQH